MKLEGKTAVVTGGAMGIGRACARAFAANGASVVIADIDREAGEQAAAEIGATGGEARFVHCDVSSSSSCTDLVDAAVGHFERIDVMHANAGVELCKSLLDTSDEEWGYILDTNLSGVFFCCREAMRVMQKQGWGGSLIATSSPLALATTREIGAYTASKGGIVALIRAFALEGAEFSIRANTLLPGSTDTPMIRREIAAAKDPEAMLQRWASAIPLGRLAEPEDVAKAALFLASDDASFVTGACLPADGGMLASLNTGPVLSYTE